MRSRPAKVKPARVAGSGPPGENVAIRESIVFRRRTSVVRDIPRFRGSSHTMNILRARPWLFGVLVATGVDRPPRSAQEADLILHHGKIVTVDRDFSIRQALAVKGDRLVRVGTDEEVLTTRGPKTTVIDLAGKMVLPGLIDSHTHPSDACLTEFDHPIPEMETIADVLDYIRARARPSAADGG